MPDLCESCNPVQDSNLSLIVLPCGYSICLNDLSILSDVFDCMFCPSHRISKEVCLNMHRNKSTLKELEYLEEVIFLEDLKDQCTKMNEIKSDLNHFINEHISSVINSIDLKREELKVIAIKQIDDYSDKLIKQVKSFRIGYEKSLEENLQFLESDQLNDLLENKREKTKIDVKEKYSFYEHEIGKIKENKTKLTRLQKQVEEIKTVEFKNQPIELELNLENTFGTLEKLPYTSDQTFDDLRTLELETTIVAHSEEITCINHAGKGEIVTVSADKTIKLWNMDNSDLNRVYDGHPYKIYDVKLIDDDRLVTCSNDSIKIWNKQSGECLSSFTNNRSSCCLEVLDDRIFSGDTNRVRRWSIISGWYTLFQFSHVDQINCIKLMNENHLLSGSDDKHVKLWDLKSLECVKTYKGHSAAVKCLERINDNEFISGSKDCDIKIWDIESEDCVMTLKGHKSAVVSFSLLENGRFLSSSSDKTIILWNSICGLALSVFEADRPITSIKTFDRNKLAIGYDNGTLEVWK